jgi:hypothetical protein
VTYGAVSAVAIKAGLTGFDSQADTALDASAATHTLTQTDQLFSTLTAYHTKYQARLDFNGTAHPASRWRLYATVTGTGGTIKALVKEYALNAPPVGGTIAIDLSNIGAQLWQLYGASTDRVATGSLAPTVDAVLIGFDETINGGGLITAANLAQTVWYINPLIGNNAWDGTAAANVAGTTVGPIASAAEYLRRTGLNRPIANAVDIYIDADLPLSDPLVITGTVTAAAGYIYVHGTNLTQAHTGTLTGYTAPNPATNALPIVTDALVADWTPYAGKLMRLTSGAHAADDAAFWIIKDLTGNNGRVAQPMWRYPAGGPLAVISLIPGLDKYEVVSPRLLGGGLIVDVRMAESSGTYQGDAYNGLRIDYCEIANFISAVGSLTGSAPNLCVFYGCVFGAWFGTGVANSFVNCQFKGAAVFAGGGSNSMRGGYWNACAISIETSSFFTAPDYNGTSLPIAIRAGSFTTNRTGNGAGGVVLFKAGIQIADVTNYFNISGGATLVISDDVYGVAATGTMYLIGSGSKMIVTALTNLRIGGATNDIKVAGKTSIFPIVAGTGLPAAAVLLCSLVNYKDPATFNGNIYDPFTGTAVLLAA